MKRDRKRQADMDGTSCNAFLKRCAKANQLTFDILASISEVDLKRKGPRMSDGQAPASPELIVPDFMTIISKIEISKPADEAWSTIGDFGEAGKYLNVDSQLISGDGEIGSVRTIGGSVVEVMVGKGPRSYTYTQTKGPMEHFSYHGSVALERTSERKSTLIYTINYDQTAMDAAAREAAVSRIRPRFQGMVEAMKVAAEATTSP